MTARMPKGRSGITLTEILISILILGVGMVSLATLFPLGLLRMREAQRYSRSKYLFEAAQADLSARNLLSKSSFKNPYYSPWNANANFTPVPYDPFVQDTPFYQGAAFTPNANAPPTYLGVYHPAGLGLPVAYDPLWRWVVYTNPASQTLACPGGPAEGRFASGVGFLRNDPNPNGGDNSLPSADGLQRLSNFNPLLTFPFAAANSNPSLYSSNTVPDIFVSPEDIVTQGDSGGQQVQGQSTVVPYPSPTSPTQFSYDIDWRYSWMFTCQQSSSGFGSQPFPGGGVEFIGDVVIFENRQFGIDLVNAPANPGQQVYAVTGETVVEAIFGYSTNIAKSVPGATAPPLPATYGYGVGASRVVLLRWPSTMPDPDVRIGNWIADVTYERDQNNATARWLHPDFPLQRCNWYQIVKRTDPAPSAQREGAFSGDPTTYRSMIVWVATPLKAMTLMNTGGTPVHVNAALICPQVVQVISTAVTSR